jgi:methylmalonyl-CoA mutase
MKKTSLFADFHEISAKEWKQKIQFDLKGAEYNESLVWESSEGIKVKPFYHSEDLQAKTGMTTARKNWKIGQYIYVSDALGANKKALASLEKGAETLCFVVPVETISLESLLRNIPLGKIAVHFEPLFLSLDFIKLIVEFFKDYAYNLFFNIDPIGNLARSGNWFFSREKDFSIVNNSIELGMNRLFRIDVSLYQNAGANMVQQLAYALAHANEYLNHLKFIEKSKREALKFEFNVSFGSNYFFEIAKLKALRILWDVLAHEYGVSADCHITVQPSKRNKTLYEYNVNMIRTTTECMAAVLGGADTIFNLPYDFIYHKDNEFASRISLNQLLLLKEESYFKEMNSAPDGAYYIETITTQLAEKGLQLFKTIEQVGGFLKQLKNHTIQKKTKESAQKEQDLFDNQKLILVGTNKFQNQNTKMKYDLELYPFVKTKVRKTLFEPIIEKRLSEEVEKQRLASE